MAKIIQRSSTQHIRKNVEINTQLGSKLGVCHISKSSNEIQSPLNISLYFSHFYHLKKHFQFIFLTAPLTHPIFLLPYNRALNLYIPCKIQQITEFTNKVFIFLAQPALSGTVFCGHHVLSGRLSKCRIFRLVTAIFISIKWSLPLNGCCHPFLSINSLFVLISTCTKRSHLTEPLI